MRVLVTGVSGFLAPHVARALLEAGHTVVGWDARPPATFIVPVLVGDLLDQVMLSRALTDIDAICHLAGVGDVHLAAAEPIRAVRDNVMATTALVQAATAAGVKRLVFASTWEVYGPPAYQPMDEAHPTQPNNPYSITKLAAERLGENLAQQSGLTFVALRLGTAYGPGMRSSTVIRRFAERARQGQPLLIQGTGRQFRQFTHVSDIAQAFCHALDSAAPAGVYNIASAERVTIEQVAAAAVQYFGGTVQHTAMRAGEPPAATIAVQRARALLGWQATVPFARGIEACFAALRAEQIGSSEITASIAGAPGE
ncbi:MAG TPA: NAD-dependent epimerase/dehydratase family protein [Dehalococcoidia bacterium]|jgi:UDP-glucose 4-epimerase|nr:NAD-dependent epimerase/dehydratase family protein [Dehalococcoidia bacterium]